MALALARQLDAGLPGRLVVHVAVGLEDLLKRHHIWIQASEARLEHGPASLPAAVVAEDVHRQNTHADILSPPIAGTPANCYPVSRS
jgi:hypothetical protein